MTIRVAINGYGRIGRNILRALFESNQSYDIELVAINDLAPIATNAHLTQFDSIHGHFPGKVSHSINQLVVNDHSIHYSQIKNLSELPWKALNIDIVFECTGAFTERSAAAQHIESGAKRVIISAPSSNADKTIVYGVNHKEIQTSDLVISNASCTTNCLAPIAQVLNEFIGIEKGLMTTIHAFTGDQKLTDSYHSDLRRARAADISMIPTKTGAAAAIGLVLPQLKGRFDGLAIRVPTNNVSLVDLTVTLSRDTTVEEINKLFKDAASSDYRGIIAYNDLPLVSIDFNHNPHSCIFDSTQTGVMGNMVKLFAWYDNEWGYSNRMLDTATVMFQSSQAIRKAS